MQLWNDYGITSYNMGDDSERLTMTYYNILNSLDYAIPELVVVDLAAIGWAGTRRDGTLKDHNFLDAVPLSLNKIRTVNDLFEGKERIEYLFPFYLYHSRWNELEERDFQLNTRNVMYGALFLYGTVSVPKPTPEMYEQSGYGNVEAEIENIQNMIDLCEERNIRIVFTYLPTGGSGGSQKLREFCAKLLEEKNVDFIDMLYMDSLDWNHDFSDLTHVNHFGGSKITDYLGEILSTKYEIPDHRQESSYAASWNSDYMKYR